MLKRKGMGDQNNKVTRYSEWTRVLPFINRMYSGPVGKERIDNKWTLLTLHYVH